MEIPKLLQPKYFWIILLVLSLIFVPLIGNCTDISAFECYLASWSIGIAPIAGFIVFIILFLIYLFVIYFVRKK